MSLINVPNMMHEFKSGRVLQIQLDPDASIEHIHMKFNSKEHEQEYIERAVLASIYADSAAFINDENALDSIGGLAYESLNEIPADLFGVGLITEAESNELAEYLKTL